MYQYVLKELKEHAPFTAFGAITGIVVIIVMTRTGLLALAADVSHTIFYVLHPAHVALSAMATTAMYRKYRPDHNLVFAVLIGYTGAIGIGTLSDCIIPYLLEILLQLPGREAHIGFIEEPWIVNPAALAGIFIALVKPVTEIPHSGHVLLSTWASLFHIIMAISLPVGWGILVVIFLFLFLAVWVPCCTSDIVFPLLFVRKK